VNNNGTGCTPCPELTFPEVVSGMDVEIQNGSSSVSNGPRYSCVLIPVTVLHPGAALSIVLIVLALLSSVISLLVIAVYTSKHGHRLIKATSRELSAIILIGTFVT